MAKVIKKKLNGMSWWMKTSLVLLLTLATSVLMYEGWYQPAPAQAAAALLQNWSSVYSGTARTTGNVAYTVPAGTNRMLVVAVSSAMTPAAATQTCTVTYGGQTLTAAASNFATSSRFHTAFYYLNEAGITAATTTTLVATVSAPTGSTQWTYQVDAAVYNGINQTTPISSNQTWLNDGTASATIGPFATGLNTPAAGDLSIEAVALSRAASGTTRTMTTWATGWASTFGPTTLANGTTAVTSLYVGSKTTTGTSTSQHTASGTTNGSMSGITLNQYIAPAGDALTVGTNTPIAVSPQKNNATGLVMQQIPVTANANSITIDSITLNTSGTASTISKQAKVYISTTNSTSTLPADAVNIGSTATGWNGTSTAVTLSAGATAGSNIITSGTAKYIYIVYDLAGGVTGTITSNVTALTAVTPDTVTFGTPNPRASYALTLTAAPVSTITSCTGCHGGTTGFSDSTGRNLNSDGLFQGSHALHVPENACSVCHVAPATETAADHAHANGTISMASPIKGGSYVRGTSFPVSNTFSPTACSATTCHGTTSPTWGNNSAATVATCVKCHGVTGTTSDQFTAESRNAAPGYVSSAPAGTGRDTGGATAITDPEVGAHNAHLNASSGYSSPVTCNNCHKNVSTTSSAFTGHMDGSGTIVFFGNATSNHAVPTFTAGNATTGGTCNTTYCHFGKSINSYAPAVTNAAVVWTDSAYLTGTPSLTGDCDKCHLSPPSTAAGNIHASATALTFTDCNGCHSHVSTLGTFVTAADKALHINGMVEAAGGSCIDCHNKIQGTRSQIVKDAAGVGGEFGYAYGHKKSTRTAVTDSDCIVCHLEGEFATQKITTLGYHKNGTIDLRAPDGTGETRITDNNGVDFTFTKYAVSYTATSRTTALGNTIAEVVTTQFCLKCHDTNGATNPTALTRNATNTATTGTQYMPFEGLNLGATYTVLNGASVAGGVVDVAKQVLSTNSSRHPIGAPNSRAYPASTRLVAPYNNIGTTRNANTSAANTASPRVKANSVVLVCDDCHTVTTAVGALPALVDRTITAHGNAVSVRGTYYVATPTLCLSCHGGVTAASTTTGYINSTNGNHNTGSAFTTGTTRVNSYMATCQRCHFSSYATAAPARPILSGDIHGNNGLLATGAAWTYGNANGMRPVAFMRNVTTWPSSTATSPRPYVATGLTAGASTCGNGQNGCSSDTHTTYAPGGSY